MAKNHATPPKEAKPDGESNPYLVKFKSALLKRWSLTRSDTLEEIANLALFLWALDREPESLAIAASIAADIPSPPPLPGGGFNYKLWYPAAFSHALVAHIGTGRLSGQAKASRAAIIKDSAIARDNAAYIADGVAEARQSAAASVGHDTIKWECQNLAQALGLMVLYVQLAKAGVAAFKPHLKAARALIPKLHSNLGARLKIGK